MKLKRTGLWVVMVIAFSLPVSAFGQGEFTICEDLIENIFHPGQTIDKKVRIFNPRKPRNWIKCKVMPHCCGPTWKAHPECYIVQKEVIQEAFEDVKRVRQCKDLSPGEALKRYVAHKHHPVPGFSGPVEALEILLKQQVEAAKRAGEPLPRRVRHKLKLLKREYDFPFTDQDIEQAKWISKNRKEAKPLWLVGDKTGRTWFDLIIVDPDLFNREECSELALWAHELIHVWQTRSHGWDYFSGVYMLEVATKGYHNTSFEIEAYAYDDILENICLEQNQMTKLYAFKHVAKRSVNMIPLPLSLQWRTYHPTEEEVMRNIWPSSEHLAVFLTQNWGTSGPYNTSPVGLSFTGNGNRTKWSIKNLNNQSIPKGAKFNVFSAHYPSFNRELAGDAAILKHVPSTGNSRGHETIIDHPLANDNPHAQIFVTPIVMNPLVPGIQAETGVIYRNGRWKIYTQDFSPMPTSNLNFNVLIIKNPNAVAEIGAFGEAIYLNGPTTASRPSGNQVKAGYSTVSPEDDLLLVTWNYGRHNKANAAPLGVYPSNDHWMLFNQDRSAMPQNGQFNVLIQFLQPY